MPGRKTYKPDPELTRVLRSRTMEQQQGQQQIQQAQQQGDGGQAQGRPLNLPRFDSNVCEKFDSKTMDAHTWLHKFMLIANWANWTNDQICFYFGLHLLTDAYSWFSNLPAEITQNFEQLKEHFIARFSLHGSTKWSILPEIFEMKQRPDQPVQEFIEKVQMKAKLINLPEDQIIGALMKGFLPQIRADLIRSNINTLADVIKESTISEQANKIKSSQSDNILSEEQLIKAIQTAMSINHAQPTSQNTISDYPNEPSKQFYKQPHSHKNYRRTFRSQNRPHESATQENKINSNYVCMRCTKQGEHYQWQCPFIDTVCHFCSKTGHIIRACKAKHQ